MTRLKDWFGGSAHRDWRTLLCISMANGNLSSPGSRRASPIARSPSVCGSLRARSDIGESETALSGQPGAPCRKVFRPSPSSHGELLNNACASGGAVLRLRDARVSTSVSEETIVHTDPCQALMAARL